MIGAMMDSKNGKMMLHQHQMMTLSIQSSMKNMLKNNPGLMQSMLSAMMQNMMGNNRMNRMKHMRRMSD